MLALNCAFGVIVFNKILVVLIYIIAHIKGKDESGNLAVNHSNENWPYAIS